MKTNPHTHLGGVAPTTRGKLNTVAAALFLYRFGLSNVKTLMTVIDVETDGWFRAATARGDFGRIKAPGGDLLVLTESTLQIAEYHAERLVPYPELDGEKINLSLVRHNLFVQDVTLRAMAGGSFTEYQTEREIMTGDVRGVKRPDVVWISNSGLRFAVEVELTSKWARHFDDFVAGIVAALDDSSGAAAYDRFVIISDSKALLHRYRESLTVGKPLHIWRKDSVGKWTIGKKAKIPDWLDERVSYRLVEGV